MSLEAAIYDILKSASGVTALVGGTSSPRIYPIGIPQGKVMPAVVFQQISSDDIVTTDNATGLRTDRVQIICWDEDPDGARALAEAVRTAMAAAGGSHGAVTILYCSILDEMDAFDIAGDSERLDRYGKQQDWEIAYNA
jgi:hypothetical protein